MNIKSKKNKDWETKRLGEVCHFLRGLTYSKKDQVEKSTNIVLRANNIDRESNTLNLDDLRYISNDIDIPEKKKLIKDSILICTASGSKSHLGKVAFIEKDSDIAFGGFMGLLVPEKEIISGEYLFKILTSGQFRDHLDSLMSGANINNLKFSLIKNFEISFPKSLTEQKRIVETLDEAFENIDQAKTIAEQNLNNIEELFESELQNTFSNNGDDWETKRLGEIGKVSMCKRILKAQTESVGDIPFYKIGTFGKTPNAFIPKSLYEEYKKKYSFPKKGDILISASGTIGRRVVYDGEPGYFQDSNIVWIDNNESQILNKYLYCFYGYCDWNPSKGATISRLYNDDLRKIEISFPKSLTEQEEMVARLDELKEKVDEGTAILRSKIAALDELKKSLLQKAFNGDL